MVFTTTITSLQITEIKTSSSSSTYILHLKKSISYIERKKENIQYFKYRTESFDDYYYYFPCTEEEEEKMQIVSRYKLVEYVCGYS